jgi:hypothetical protein
VVQDRREERKDNVRALDQSKAHEAIQQATNNVKPVTAPQSAAPPVVLELNTAPQSPGGLDKATGTPKK